MTNKTCRQCNRDLSINQFYTHPMMADGHLNKCKDCVKRRVNKHRSLNVEEARAYDRARFRTEARRQYIYETTKRLQEKYPDKYKARVAVGNALRDGRLVRQPCWCGKLKTEAHHTDYAKPLDVIWLCTEHHNATHHTSEMPF